MDCVRTKSYLNDPKEVLIFQGGEGYILHMVYTVFCRITKSLACYVTHCCNALFTVVRYLTLNTMNGFSRSLSMSQKKITLPQAGQ